MKHLFPYLAFLLLLSCEKTEEPMISNPVVDEALYFPPIGGEEWETTAPNELGWDMTLIDDLDAFMEESQSRALLVLKNGKIVIEKYAGETLLGLPFGVESNWYWASAAKTLTATLAGIGIQENYIDLNASSSEYLGHQWSSMTEAQEDAVQVFHHLTMTTGLETAQTNVDCTEPSCLTYRVEPGSRWFYHNAPYTILDQIIAGATNQDFDGYFNAKLKDPIGMDGFWTYSGYNHLYFSTARAMARFGILVLNEGFWDEDEIINSEYVSEMTHTSQTLNESYGYLWWLNGKDSHILPGLGIQFNGMLVPEAPENSFAAMGKNGQLLHIVPDEKLIVVRFGDDPDESLVPMKLFKDLWSHLDRILYPN